MFEGLFQPMHLMIIAGIALLVFGPKKLPELGKGMGEGIRGFKAAMQGKEELPPAATLTPRKLRRKRRERSGDLISELLGLVIFGPQKAEFEPASRRNTRSWPGNLAGVE